MALAAGAPPAVERGARPQEALAGGSLALLVLGIAALGSGSLALSPLLPDVAMGLGAGTVGEVGLALGLYGLSIALVAPFAGPLVDRLAPRRAIAGGLLVVVSGLVLAAAAPNLAAFGAGQALAGAGAALYLPGSYAYVAARASEEGRGRALGLLTLGWSLSLVVGVPLGAVAASAFGWRGALIGVATLALLVTAAVAVWLPGAARAAPAARAALVGGHGAALRVPGARAVLLANLLLMFGWYGAYTYLGATTRVALGLGPAGAALLVMAYGLGFTLSALNGAVLDRAGKARILPVLLLGLAALLAVLPLAAGHSLVLLLPVLLIWGMLQNWALAATLGVAGGLSDALRGRIMALVTCTTHLGLLLGAGVLGRVDGALGYPAVGLACAAATLVAAGAATGLARRAPHDAAAARDVPLDGSPVAASDHRLGNAP